MLLKWLLVGGVIYFIYRFYIAPLAIEGQQPPSPGKDQKDDEGEFIDYEEVED
ncbi:MAG: hypothetical protein AAF798_01900 [Bacteroidota bacterium]